MRRGFVRPALATFVAVLFALGWSVADGVGDNDNNDVDPEANAIVAGERIGDLPPIGTPGAVIRSMPNATTLEITVPPGTLYRFADDGDAWLYTVTVCAASDSTWLVTIHAHSENERFTTAEGVGLASSEDAVLAALGEPDVINESSVFRSLRYEAIDGSGGLMIVYRLDDLEEADRVSVYGACDG